MSQKNVEIVGRWMWAFDNDTDAFREVLHPEIEWMPLEDNNTPARGVDGAMRIRNGWLDTWDEHDADVHEILDRGGEHVFGAATVIGRGKASGVGVEMHIYAHFKVRDGKVVYIYEYPDRATAAKALRLEE
jgi:ketosteroid isomerase-like protein